MTTTKKVLICSGAALVLGGAAYYKYAKDNLDFKSNGVSITGITAGRAEIGIGFLVSSKIGIGFTITDIAFDIYSGGVIIGSGKLPAPVYISGNSSVPIQVNVTLDLGQVENLLGHALSSLITGGNGLTSYIQGNAKVVINAALLSFFTVNIPFSENYQLSL